MTVENFDVKEMLADERRRDRKLAQAFASACMAGDLDTFYAAANGLHNSSVDGWRLASERGR